jgi:peptidoglycan/LPS O-acetylase OafA/YrhL
MKADNSASGSADSVASGGHGLRHIPELDGIRGIAALVVFGHHAFNITVRATVMAGGWPHGIERIYSIFAYANTGVDLFFVLSGFLITSILIGQKNSNRFYQDFYWKRSLRILPLYILTIALVWVFFHQTTYMLMALFFVVNFAGIARVHVVGEVGPFWSLGIEEQFYLVWPTLVRRLTVRQILRSSIAIGLGCIVLRMLLALRGHHDYGLTPQRCDGLAFGSALACHFSLAGANTRLRRKADPLLWMLMVLGGVLLAMASRAGLLGMPLFQTGVVLVTGPIIGLCISHTGSLWLGILRSRVLTFFGLISYAFYLVHIYVILLYEHFHGPLATGDVRGYWTQILVTFGGSIGVALVSRYAIELPAMGLRKYVLKHPNLAAEEEHPPLPLAQM